MITAHRGRTLSDWGILCGIYLTVLFGIFGAFVSLRTLAATSEANRNAAEANEIAREDGKVKAELTVAKVEASIRGGLTGVERGYDPRWVENDDLWGVHIDITARNAGNSPAFLSKATLTFHTSGYLEPCYAMGGPIESKADYQFVIPKDQAFASPKDDRMHKTPFWIERELTHKIPQNDYEKFTLTVGQEIWGEESSPWFGIVTVDLEHGDGKELTIGPLALTDGGQSSPFHPEGDTWLISPEHIQGCTKRNAVVVADIMHTPKVEPSKELASLHKAFAPYR